MKIAEALAKRADFRAIARWIEPEASVLDLGCSDGTLLDVLRTELNVQAFGVEIRDEGVLACVGKGLNVLQ
jgi:methionine biosynthesis protein MetW